MKLDDDQNGLVPVDKTAALNAPVPNPHHRSVPMKRTGEKLTTDKVTPGPIGGTGKIKAVLESAIAPLLEEFNTHEYNSAVEVVNGLIPRIIAARSAQTETRIAAHVRHIAEEVAIDSLATFPGFAGSNTVSLQSMADSLFDELCPV